MNTRRVTSRLLISRFLSCSAAVFSLLPLFVHADDTEIYTGIAERDAPNVIFIMDTSGSMAWANDGTEDPPKGESRLEQVQKAAIDTINNTDGINIALMRFRGSRGGFVDMPITPVASARSTFETKMNGYVGKGSTPITETLDEALRYLSGSSVTYGKNNSTYYSHTNSYSSSTGKYKSPISHQCQKSHIVLFSDGSAQNDTSSNDDIQDWLKTVSSSLRPSVLSTSCSGSGGCAEELAFYGNQKDLSTRFDGIQNVTFHTIGGFVQGNPQTKLKNIAKYGSWAAPGKPINPDKKEGNGLYANVQNYAQLKKSLEDVFNNIAKTSSTFTAPAVSVNAFNNLEHLDQLYYSVFKPSDSAGWSGNLKRYRLTGEGIIEDVNEDPAVDPTTGFFSKDALSFWTLGTKPDGNEVSAGGAASRLTNTRKVTTFLGADKRLSATANRVTETNSALVTALLNLPPSEYTEEQVKTLIKWAKGIDVKDEDNDSLTDDARGYMEDPLHSQPVVINYGKNVANKTFDSSIYISTNSGFLHAFSTNKDNPKEHFAFIPEELLPNLYQYFSRTSSFDKIYGLDGPLSYWHKDDNKNGVILDSANAQEANEHIFLYQGMRRGGRSYYALDISNRDDPKYLWQIDHTDSGFAKLGQTWSKMTPATVRFSGKEEKVLFFGGGYDPAEDSKSKRSNSSMGNAIYMVRAKTGALLWSSSNSNATLNISQMKNSIVADIVPIDSTQDGFTNILYTADVGGRIFRIDLDNNATSENSFARGGVLADFNGGTETSNIRFFNTPDIAFTRYGDFSPEGQLQISIGSGYRAHPLDTRVTDRFYILNDTHVSTVPTNYSNHNESDLADLTQFSSASKTRQKVGSYYKLTTSGEKVLASSVTVANNILFTTYRPLSATAAASCDADTGSTRLYQLSPTYNDDARLIEIKDLAQGGIPPNPVVLFPPPPKPAADNSSSDTTIVPSASSCETLKGITTVGAETVDTNITRCDQLSKTYWRTKK